MSAFENTLDLYSQETKSTYDCCRHNDRREENGFEDLKCLLQFLQQHAVVRLDDVIPKGHEEISLQGDLE